MADSIAPDGQIWVCLACGKTSEDQYGIRGASDGWDESCMMHAVLCHVDKLVFAEDGDRATKVEEGWLVKSK